jgi:hypothetical protein
VSSGWRFVAGECGASTHPTVLVEALVLHVSDEVIRDLLTFAGTVAQRDIPRFQVLTEVVRYCADRPLGLARPLIGSLPADAVPLKLDRDVSELLGHLVTQAQLDGDLRADIPAHEVVRLLRDVVCGPRVPVDKCLTTVVLDGLCATSSQRVSDGDHVAGADSTVRTE